MLLGFDSSASAQQSTQLNVSVPGTVKLNSTVTLSATLADAWDNRRLAGVPVEIGVGDRYAVTTTRFNTSNAGQVSRSWRFTQAGRYRVTFKFGGGWGYLDSRTTVFVNVVR